MPPGSLTFDNTHSRAGYSMAGGTSAKTTMSQSDRSPFFESRPAERGGGVDPDFSPDDDELNDINTPIEPGHSQGREGTLVEQLRQLDNKLTTVTEERDAARRSMETIRSQLQDEVGRLRRQLQETPQQVGAELIKPVYLTSLFLVLPCIAWSWASCHAEGAGPCEGREGER